MASYGETHFHAEGFVLVLLAALFSGFRWALTQLLMTGGAGAGRTGWFVAMRRRGLVARRHHLQSMRNLFLDSGPYILEVYPRRGPQRINLLDEFHARRPTIKASSSASALPLNDNYRA